ncbi:MAG: hypothetical protein HFG92_12175 [Dorea sp.]|jgi:CDP-glycerol glycerophosphotransferase|nr:hypothetical protein [Dorea sp.]
MKAGLMRECRMADTLYIYGAGAVADIFYIYLKQKGMQDKVRAFVVTKLGGNVPEKFGLKVVELAGKTEALKKALVVVAVQEGLQDEIREVLRENGISGYCCVDSRELLDRFYEALYREPVNGHKVLLQNQSGEGYGGNPKYIAEKLLEADKERKLELVWAVSHYRESFPERIRQVIFGSEEYYRELATAKVWIDNSRKGQSVRKREGQFYVQAWHGAAPVKRVEKDVEDKLPAYYIEGAKNDSKMADVFLSGSEFYTGLYRSSFWYDGVILKYGLPRHDVFWDMEAAREKVRRFYQVGKEAAIVLYAPTFRDHAGVKCYDLDLERVVCALEQRFHKRFQMMVSRHPVNYREYSFRKDAEYLLVGEYDDFQELLAAADVLITDYSGCMYDFSYTGRPVFLYQKDYREYLEDRNFYIPIDRLPYVKAHSNDELVEEIENFNEESYADRLASFMDSMGNYDRGDASEKVAAYLREHVLDLQ